MELNPWVLKFCVGLLALAALFSFIRLARGPTLPDRLVAFDVLALTGVAGLALAAVVTRMPTLLDVLLVWALVSFLSTIAFATYWEKRGRL